MKSDNVLRLGYFADGAWAYEAFKLLVQDKRLEIVFIVPRADTKDDTLRHYSEKYNIDYIIPGNINSHSFYEKLEPYKCDLFVSMSFNQIFKRRLIDLPKLGTINCHAGKLPFYRGRNVLIWALINDEKEFGITVHYVDEGIDTGDIILQKTYPISDLDDYSTLLDLAYKECAILLYEAISNLRTGINTTLDQSSIHPVGFYCGKRGEGDEIINWNQSSRDLFNFIRALCYPGPKATTYIRGNEIKVNRSRQIPSAPSYKNTPGQVLKKTSEGYLVKTSDSFIEILEIESSYKIKVGDKLG